MDEQIDKKIDKQIDRFKYDFDIFDVLIDWWIDYSQIDKYIYKLID